MTSAQHQDIVLVVDPEQDSLDLFRLLFKKHYTILTAETPSEAFALLKTHDVKVMVVEQMQREQPGIVFLRDAATLHPRTERILVTGTPDNHTIMDAFNIGGVFHYVLKPYQAGNLKGIIDKAIDKHNLRKQNDYLISDLQKKNKELSRLLNRLKIEEKKFRDIFNSSRDPIVIVDKGGIVAEANEQACSGFGFSRDDLGLINFLGIIHNDYVKNSMQFFTGINHSNALLFETVIRTSDAQWKSFEINGHVVQFQGTEALLLMLRDTTERKETEKRILQTIIQTEESERRHFAQELHDGIGPLLSTVKLYLQWMNKPNSKVDKNQALQKIEMTLDETIQSVRQISNRLSPTTLVNFGLEAAIKSIFDRVNDMSELKCNLRCTIPERLPDDLEATIFRIVGESVNNTIKHACASEVDVYIVRENNRVTMSYRDDGIGFDVDALIQQRRGNGLANMKSRVVSMGGNIEIESGAGAGTYIGCKFILS
ncbi:MAG: PAS domain S-box protein [Marinilabiliaceae bacterium]|nr:PAS domain S-box protein [Marinilabiliaceae bacterium]